MNKDEIKTNKIDSEEYIYAFLEHNRIMNLLREQRFIPNPKNRVFPHEQFLDESKQMRRE